MCAELKHILIDYVALLFLLLHRSVEEDSYDHVAATYFLLAERKLKKQYEADDLEKPPQNKHKGTLSKPPQVTPR